MDYHGFQAKPRYYWSVSVDGGKPRWIFRGTVSALFLEIWNHCEDWRPILLSPCWALQLNSVMAIPSGFGDEGARAAWLGSSY
jgi:hypothetical protein